MPSYVYDANATALCPHGGQVTATPTQTRVRVGGSPALTQGDTFLVSGCPFTTPAGSPYPCVRLQWVAVATRVRAGGQFLVLQTSTGLALSAAQTPQGPPNVVSTQTRVRAT